MFLDDDRCKVMGGSDAVKIMQGKWNQLYREKKKLVEVEDLSNVFRVQLGIFTQKFNLDWFINRIRIVKSKLKKRLLQCQELKT